MKKYTIWDLIVTTLLGITVGTVLRYVVVPPKNEQVKQLEEIIVSDHIQNNPSFIISYADTGTYEWKLPISFREYLEFKKKSHTVISNEEYLRFVTYNNPTIRDIAKALTKESKSKEHSAQTLFDFVHQQIYDSTIEEKVDYVRYPIETIVDRNGDCEDLSILAASLMKSIGIDVALIVIEGKDEKEPGHVALGINGKFLGTYYKTNGNKYYYAETTGTNWLNKKSTWKIGGIPKENIQREAMVLPIN